MSIEELKNRYFEVLDFGFVAVKDWMGNDIAITEMARNSYQVKPQSVFDDGKLIRHLMRHKHTSPFERCELVLHCGMPIFVARQWIRHRTASLNEYSGRYSIMPLLFYTPDKERCRCQSTINKQGSSPSSCFDETTPTNSTYLYNAYELSVKEIRQVLGDHYKTNLKTDMARELARIDLPLSMYTYWYWKIDLHNLLHFLQLRLAEDAQWEIRQYAKVIAGIVKKWCPITWKAFEDYRLNGVYFSSMELQLIRHLYAVQHVGWEESKLEEKAEELGLSKKELSEFVDKYHSSDNKQENYDLDISKTKSASYYEKLTLDSVSEL